KPAGLLRGVRWTPAPNRTDRGQARPTSWPANSTTPYATGSVLPIAKSTAEPAHRIVPSPATAIASCVNCWRAVSAPRTKPMNADPPVTAATRAANAAGSVRNIASPRSQDAEPVTMHRTTVAEMILTRPARICPSPPYAAPERATQCCSGKVNAAAAKPQEAHSTEIGAAAIAPRARVLIAKNTYVSKPLTTEPAANTAAWRVSLRIDRSHRDGLGAHDGQPSFVMLTLEE